MYLRYTDALIVAVAAVAFTALTLWDLGSWRYSFIGDEYAHYELPVSILNDGLQERSLASQDGVYEKYPVANSAAIALWMAIWGDGAVAWRSYSIACIVLTMPALYLIAHAIATRRAGIITLIVLGCSHYLYAAAHTGYGWLDCLPVTAWALLALMHGLRRQHFWLLLAAGALIGCSLYTHYSGRAVIAIAGLYLLSSMGWRQWRWMIPVAIGALTIAAPTLHLSGWEIVERMMSQTAGGYTTDVSGPPLERILRNTLYNTLGWVWQPSVHSYVYGGLVDPISAAMALTGVVYLISRIKVEVEARLILFWLLVPYIVLALLSPYPDVPITRLWYLMPPISLAAGIGVSRLSRRTSPLRGTREAYIAIGSAACMMLALNATFFWGITPQVHPYTQESLTLAALREPACRGALSDAVILSSRDEHGVRHIIDAYYPGAVHPTYVDLSRTRSIPHISTCAVIVRPQTAGSAVDFLLAEYPQASSYLLRTQASAGVVVISPSAASTSAVQR